VRAHLLGGVPVSEVTDNRPLFDALGFNPAQAFAQRKSDAMYFDFSPVLPNRPAILHWSKPTSESKPVTPPCARNSPNGGRNTRPGSRNCRSAAI
jgi:hypothetical protein